MSSKAYIVPSDFVTPANQDNYRVKALAAGIQRGYNLGIQSWDKIEMPLPADPATPTIPEKNALIKWLAAGNWPRNLDAREFQPNLDAAVGAAVDFWNTAPLIGALGTEYSCLGATAVAAAANRIKKIVVFFSVQIITSPLPVNRLLFRRNNATGLLQSEFDLEQLATMQRVAGFFSEPVVWDNNTAYAVNAASCIATGVACKLILGNIVLEPAGTTNV